jgi:adenine-specific DNA-methyltransferase
MLVPESKFDFPKSIHTVYDCLYAVVGDRKNAIVLDFFAGSGTTGHAVLEMNSVDDGNRRFILCTNNEGGICEEITYPRISAVLKGYKYKGKKTEVLYSKPVTVTNFKNSSKILDEIEEVKRLNSSKFQTIQTGMKNGEIVVTGVTDSNVEVPGIQGSLKYLKVEFYPIADKMYLEYAGDIFEEITPLIEIENGVHLGDSEAIRLIRNEEEFENLMSDSQKNENLRKLYLWHDVLIDDDQRKLLTEKDIELIFLPDQYYDELERIQ